MYQLKNVDYIAKGLHRECYQHPDNKDLCIKVVVNGDDAETQREQNYYKLLQSKSISWDLLPRYHGNVETDLGSGAVFDLIRDGDSGSSISKTFEHYLGDEGWTQFNYHGLLQALRELKKYLLSNNIITMTLKPKNIVYRKQEKNKGQLIIIDNIGNSDFIPVASHCKHIGRLKILRKWQSFEISLIKNYPENRYASKLVFELNKIIK